MKGQRASSFLNKQPLCTVLQHVAMANPLHGLCSLLYFHLKYKESLLPNRKTLLLQAQSPEEDTRGDSGLLLHTIKRQRKLVSRPILKPKHLRYGFLPHWFT